MHRHLLVAPLLVAFYGCGATTSEPRPPVSSAAEQLHRDAIVIDGHNDITTFLLDYNFDLGMKARGPEKRDATLYWVPQLRWLLPHPRPEELLLDTDLALLRSGGVDAQFFSIFVEDHYAVEDEADAGRAMQRAMAMIDSVERQARLYPDAVVLAYSTDDIRTAAAQGKLAALMGVEGGHAIEGDLDNLRELYNRGARYMTLTWNNANRWADSCYEHPHGGLTEFGTEVVSTMNHLGMMIDISHVSDATFYDVLAVTRAPVIASHSSMRSIADHPRNLTDDMLRALATNGGIVMVNFQDTFIDPAKDSTSKAVFAAISHLGWPPTPMEQIVDHIEHAIQVAGIDHVGLGSDFASSFNMPAGMQDVSQFPRITEALLARGYTEEDIRKVLGENLLRVFAAAENTAQQP